MVLLAAAGVAGAGLGMGAAWMLWGQREPAGERSRGGIVARTPVRDFAVEDAARRAALESADEEHSVSIVEQELQRLRAMLPQEFALKFIELRTGKHNLTDPDKNLLCGLYLSHCDSERAMAVMKEYKRQGTGPESLGLFFISAGKVDGKRLVQRMLAEATPETKYQWGLNAVAHGWGAAHPREAVAWLNSIPDGAPYYVAALQGMMWGIAETAPDTALQVFEQLSVEDRFAHTNPGISPGESLGRSVLTNHGMKAFSELLAGISDPVSKQKLLSSSMADGMKVPPEDFVRCMAGPLEYAPDIRGNFETMASRWVAAAPDTAMQWLRESAQQPGNEASLSIVAAQLARSDRSRSLTDWLAANPGIPGRTAVAAGLAQKGGTP
jgi:hypothetical protein